MKTLRNAALLAPLALLVACGASNDSSPSQTGTVSLMLSDSSTEDWSLIGVKVLSIALVPQGGGAPVTVFTAPTPAPVVNLVQLDQLGEILGNVQVPPGTYSRDGTRGGLSVTSAGARRRGPRTTTPSRRKG